MYAQLPIESFLAMGRCPQEVAVSLGDHDQIHYRPNLENLQSAISNLQFQYPFCLFTTHTSGSPATKRRTFSRYRRHCRSRAPSAWPPMCGLTTTFGYFHSGWSVASGSGSVTSRPTPAICFLSSAANMSLVLTKPPRAMLMNSADGFIASNWAAPNMPRVSAVNGTARTTTSALG